MATNAELTEENRTLKARVTSAEQLAKDKGEALDQANDRANTAEEALSKERTAHAQTKRELADARDEVAGAADVIQELNVQLSQAEEASTLDPNAPRIVEHEGRKFHVLQAKFHYAGQDYTGADVLDGSALLADLVRIKSGVLAEVAGNEADAE